MSLDKVLRYATIRECNPVEHVIVLDCFHEIVTISLSKADYDWFARIRQQAANSLEVGFSSHHMVEISFVLNMDELTCLDVGSATATFKLAARERDRQLFLAIMNRFYDGEVLISPSGKATFYFSLPVQLVEKKESDDFEERMYPESGYISSK